MSEEIYMPLNYRFRGFDFGENLFKEKPDLPEKYIINEHVCVCHWKDGTITKSFKHESDIFNKKLGFLLCCFRHYNAKMSKNKQKKVISWIKYEYLEDYLFDMFVEKTKMTVKQAEAYIRDLKIEETKQKSKHMKEETEFKVGDTVEVTEEFDCAKKGQIGKITKVNSQNSILVKYDDDNEWWIDGGRLKLIKEEK